MGNKGIHGRGAGIDPPNRFETTTRSVPLDLVVAPDEESSPKTTFHADRSRSVVSENSSPDVGFRYSLNPYRGCEHGCSYCYARPTHEYLGLDAGVGFETNIQVKHDAPRLFREFLARPTWTPELIVLSGVTDPYQPCERRYGLTRRCLEVAAACGQPVGVITKNALILRDLDVLSAMAAKGLAHAAISITTLDPELGGAMEPRASAPAGRLRAIRELSAAGVPVRAMLAPVVPGLTEHELPKLMEAVRDAGAHAASAIVLRLPYAVAPVFADWLQRTFPEKEAKVLGRIRDLRGGKLNDPRFGHRMTGSGAYAEELATVFRVFARKFGLDGDLPPYDFSHFVPPADARGQGRLF